ncbi:tetratricopeptide repeat protein [Desulfohalovibrio reitneri]|uniref:tetratricopeptide repeat protein n=1 Tax=Desulfohalovibrio reitneri TaxID=1307759 RepID=UPI000690F037|nr:tetratricopeptide repeat protein [Desulfohalovibrio reitneri]
MADKLSRRELLFGLGKRFKARHWKDEWDRMRADQNGNDGRPARPPRRDTREGPPTLLVQGKLEDAEALLLSRLEEDPEDVESRCWLGVCLYRRGQYVRSRCELSRVCRKGGPPAASLHLGLAHARQGDMDKAAEIWRNYFEPDNTAVQREVNLQLALHESGSCTGEECAQAVERALGYPEGEE